MPRTKGAKNKSYKEVSVRGICTTYRFKQHVHDWLMQQPNRNGYVQSLIEKDMKEKGFEFNEIEKED
jgi:hypothetical protein